MHDLGKCGGSGVSERTKTSRVNKREVGTHETSEEAEREAEEAPPMPVFMRLWVSGCPEEVEGEDADGGVAKPSSPFFLLPARAVYAKTHRYEDINCQNIE